MFFSYLTNTDAVDSLGMGHQVDLYECRPTTHYSRESVSRLSSMHSLNRCASTVLKRRPLTLCSHTPECSNLLSWDSAPMRSKNILPDITSRRRRRIYFSHKNQT